MISWFEALTVFEGGLGSVSLPVESTVVYSYAAVVSVMFPTVGGFGTRVAVGGVAGVPGPAEVTSVRLMLRPGVVDAAAERYSVSA